jgi:ribose transport system ATP-binding protein
MAGRAGFTPPFCIRGGGVNPALHMTELRLDSLSRTYGSAAALNRVSLTLRAGEVHALMGENGAGKSTLIRLIAGLERPDGGTLVLNGQTVSFGSAADAQAAGLRFIHQELQIVPALSVAENMHLGLSYPQRLGLIRWAHLRRTAAAALARLGLDRIDPAQPMSRLGPGDQMLVRIASTLIGQGGPAPWLYVMDEPTAALTGAEAERLFDVIAELKAQGAGILYVSHRMAEVMRLSDRITVLRDGTHISTSLRAETDQTRLIHDMTGRDLSDLFPARSPAIMKGRTGPVLTIDRLSAPGLTEISVTVGAGEVLGLTGLSGSGRGAVLRALMGDLTLTGGSISLNGQPLGKSTPKAWAQGIAYVPRERRSEGLIPTGSVQDNVVLPHLAALARSMVFPNRGRERRLVTEMGTAVRLKSTGAGQAVGQLSGGNQQKVLFARAIGGGPRILLLDEPTRGVDIGAKFDIYRLIRQFCDQGLAVIMASSDLPEVIGLSDRIAVLQSGRLAHLVDNNDLTEAALLALCYDTTDRKALA